jgi:hypothetical protein
MVAGVHLKLVHSGRRARQWTSFRRALAQIGPCSIVVSKAAFSCLVHHIDNTGAGNVAKAWYAMIAHIM